MYKITLNLFFIFAILLSSQLTFGQQKCATSTKRAAALENNPELQQRRAELEAYTQQWIANNAENLHKKAVETIPVVVHVLWKANAENISDEQIQSQMSVLNEDFRKLNSDATSGPTVFQAISADIEVEFCLAAIDPDGNETTGITRTQTSISTIGETEDYYSTSRGGADAWDISKYLNIWVCDLGDDLLGFAYPPGMADPVEADGVVINFNAFGTTGAAANNYPNDLGRTATHEVGHYLNLEHLWGPEDGGCSEDDFVNDTPEQFTESEGCPQFPLTDDCTASGNGVMYNNYMDYVNDEYMNAFTNGQKARMLAALAGPRSGLLDGGICGAQASIQEVVLSTFRMYPNPAGQSTEVTIENINGSTTDFAVYSLLGDVVLEFTVSNRNSINISSLPNGVYYVASTIDGKKTSVQKLMVAR
jgi:hypothetical protein